ncbi:MAG: TonB-dependent receptor [Sphingomonas sp. 28-66-16]|nr:MAG: TonB-dependent receptor [Sphingomonas sp. 28-66-16]
MRRLTLTLCATTAFVMPLAARAADPEPRVPVAPADASADAAAGDDIIVLGKGETRQVQQINQADIAILAAGTSPLKAIQKLPSVNFQSADPFGAYEWSQRISIRGFNQNQLGFTLDGIPLGDGSYGNTNGLHISRAISSENVARTRVSQGAGSIGTQATNNLGGTIEFFSSDPLDRTTLAIDGTYGSQDTGRIFARLDTGTLGASGARAYVSYTYFDVNKWKGFGAQRQHQVNAKFIAPVSYFRLVGTFAFSDRRENDYQDLSLNFINRLGYRWDNISNNFPLAVQIADIAANRGDSGAPRLNPAAGTVYPAPFQTVDDAYFNASGLRQDYLGSIGIETGDDTPLRGQVKAYYHNNHGQGLWWTPYVPSPTGVPISVRTTEYDISRKGVFGSLGGTLGWNDITVGAWYEFNDFRQARRFYALDSRAASSRNSLRFQTNPFFTQWEFRYQTETFQYYVEDKIALGDVTINLGWKGFDVTNSAVPVIAGGLAQGKIKATDWFQPHAGVAWKPIDNVELFAGFTQVTRAFVSAATSGPFATTQAGFNALTNTNRLKPESSDTYEVGGRFKLGPVNGLLAAYYVDFRNRLLGVTTGAGIVGNPVILQNVGSVRSYGFEAAAEARLGAGFGAFVSYSYNDSTYRDDVGAIPIAGKTVVDSPKNLLKGEVTYDSAILFGRIGANYTSRRYFTYTNDQSVPGYVIVDLTIGARLRLASDRQVELQLNATNLFDKQYVSTIGSNGFGNAGDNQTLLAGAPQQFFITLKTRL